MIIEVLGWKRDTCKEVRWCGDSALYATDENVYVITESQISFLINRFNDLAYKQALEFSFASILSVPTRKITIIEAGLSVVAFTCNDSTFWTVGMNTINPTIPRSALQEPKLQLSSSLLPISQIAVGYGHILLVTKEGRLYAMGRGESGQLGTGARCQWAETPIHIPVVYSAAGRTFDESVVSVSAGSLHSALLTATGRVYTFGCGSSCRLAHSHISPNSDSAGEGAMGWGMSSSLSSSSSKRSREEAATAINDDKIESVNTRKLGSGNVMQIRHDDDDVLSPLLVQDLEGVGALQPDGTASGVLLVRCGVWHTVAVARDSFDVYVWGWTKFGQSGREKEELISSPRRVAELDDFLRTDEAEQEEEIADVKCGSRFTAILTTAGRVIIMYAILKYHFRPQSMTRKRRSAEDLMTRESGGVSPLDTQGNMTSAMSWTSDEKSALTTTRASSITRGTIYEVFPPPQDNQRSSASGSPVIARRIATNGVSGLAVLWDYC